MKLVLVTTIERGGPLECARLLAREMAAAGAAVRAVVATDALADAFAAPGVEPVVIRSRAALEPGSVVAVRRACRGADVVHSHDRRSGFWIGLALPPWRRCAFVHSLHGLPESYLPAPAGPQRPGLRGVIAYRVVERALANRTDALVVPSNAAAAMFASRLGYPLDRLTIVPNGVDADAVQPPGTRALIGTMSALEPVKGIDVFLRAAAELLREDPSLRFAVFGTGPLEASLRSLAVRLGVGSAVCFAGHVSAPVALGQLKIFVQSSHFETCSLALLEAMAAGVPAVATNVGGVPEQAPAAALMLVRSGDASALAHAIRCTLADPAAAAARAEHARGHIRRERSAAGMAKTMATVYERALDRG